MEKQPKKPPIEIGKLGKGNGNGGRNPEPGALEYQGNGGGGGISQGGKAKFNWVQLIAGALLALLIALGMIQVQVVPGLNTLEDNDDVLMKRFDGYAEKSTVDNIITWQGTVALKDNLNDYALKSSIPSAPDLSNYYTKSEVDAAIAAALAVKEEEKEEEEQTSSPEGWVVADLRDNSVYLSRDGETLTYNDYIRLDVENTSSHDLRDIIFELSVDPSRAIYELEDAYIESDIDWWADVGKHDILFESDDGYDLEAGEDDTVRMYLEITLDESEGDSPPESIKYDLEVKVIDADIDD